MAKPAHVTQVCYDKAMAYIPVAAKNAEFDTYSEHICAGALFNEQGRVVAESDGYVCHAFMTHKPLANRIFVNAMPSRYFKKEDEEANRAFLTYLKEKSSFRNFILNEDVETMFEGAVVIDGAIGSNAMMYLVKALRMTVEDTWRIPFWYEMVKRGVHPMLAFTAANIVTSNLTKGGCTHNTVMYEPSSKGELQKLCIDHLPSYPGKNDNGEWNSKAVFGINYHQPFYYGERAKKRDSVIPLPAEGGKVEKVPDGWGGYIERKVPCDVDCIAKDLVELQKETMK